MLREIDGSIWDLRLKYPSSHHRVQAPALTREGRPAKTRTNPHGASQAQAHPTAGASDDYAYSRQFLGRRKGKLLAYTVEYGRTRASTPFHPPYPEMRKVMREVAAGLLALCAQAAAEAR